MRKWGMVLLLAALACAALAFTACGGGGEEKAFSLHCPAELHLPAGTSDYDFDAEGKAVFEDGTEKEAVCDASGVRLGEPGRYEIVYSYGDKSAVCAVYLYGAPTIRTEELTLSYAEAVTSGVLSEGILAQDSFGNRIEVAVADYGGFYGTNGRPVFGSHTVRVAAADRVGGVAEASVPVRVTRNEDNCPSFSSSSAAYDLSSPEELALVIDLKAASVTAVYFGTREIDKDLVKPGEAGIVFDTDALLERVGAGVHEVRVETENGYALTTLTVSDTEVPRACLESAVEGYLFRRGAVVSLPKGMRSDTHQRISFEYDLTGPNGAVTLTNGAFTAAAAGSYTYDVTALSANGKSVTVSSMFRVLEEDDYRAVIDPVTSEQFFRERIFLPPGMKEGFSFLYDAEGGGGRAPVYTMTGKPTTTAEAWYNRFELNYDYYKDINVAGYDYLAMDVYLTKVTDIVVWVGTTALSYSKGEIYLSDENGDAVGYGALAENLNRWLTLRASVKSFDGATKRIALGLHNGGEMYLTDLRWELVPVPPLVLHAENGRVFAAGAAPDFAVYYENAASVEFTVTFPNGTQSRYDAATLANFLPAEGIYGLRVQAVGLDGTTKSAEVDFMAFDGDPDSVYAAYGGQAHRITVPVPTDMQFAYDAEKRLGDVIGAFRALPGTRGSWYSRIEFEPSYFRNVDLTRFDTMTVNVWLSEAADLVVWLNTTALKLSLSQLSLFDPTTGRQLMYPDLSANLNKWLTLQIPLRSYDMEHATKRFALGTDAKTEIWFSFFRLERCTDEFLYAGYAEDVVRFTPAATEGFGFDYDESANIGGETGMFVLQTSSVAGKSGAWNNRIDFAAGYLNALGNLSAYDTLSFRLYATDKADMVVWLNRNSFRLTAGTGMRLYDENGAEISYTDWQPAEWVTVRIDMTGYVPGDAEKRIGIGSDAAGATLYIRDMKLLNV